MNYHSHQQQKDVAEWKVVGHSLHDHPLIGTKFDASRQTGKTATGGGEIAANQYLGRNAPRRVASDAEAQTSNVGPAGIKAHEKPLVCRVADQGHVPAERIAKRAVIQNHSVVVFVAQVEGSLDARSKFVAALRECEVVVGDSSGTGRKREQAKRGQGAKSIRHKEVTDGIALLAPAAIPAAWGIHLFSCKL